MKMNSLAIQRSGTLPVLNKLTGELTRFDQVEVKENSIEIYFLVFMAG